MEHVNLGRTGLKVSRICLGTMTYGTSKWHDWVLDKEDSRPFFESPGSGHDLGQFAPVHKKGSVAAVAGWARRPPEHGDTVRIAGQHR